MSPSLLDAHDGVLFDLDGVLYAGSHAIDGAPQAVHAIRSRGLVCGFVTNNASRSARDVAAHLTSLGISAEPAEIFGSAPAAVALMASEIPEGERVLVTGSDYLRRLVVDAGFHAVEDSTDDPAAVIQGFDPQVRWTDLAEAAFAVNNGARWYATNRDLTIPRERGVAPGNGALVDAVSRATSTEPRSAGKPEPTLFRQAIQQLHLRAPLVIGDRLDTDVLGGNRAGCTTALVLTGIDSAETADAADPQHRPDHVLGTLEELFTVRESGVSA